MTTLDAELAYQPIHALMRRMMQGQLTSRKLVELYLQRIARYDPKLHAFVSVDADEALRAAASADEARAAGTHIGQLHGIPIVVKDLMEIEGRVTSGGSRHWEHRVSTTTASVVRRAMDAGMIVLGKAHTVEFALGGYGDNQQLGTPWNPWDANTHRAPGGSSSGTAVAVAAAMAPCGLGTDTGGSVRIPSSWCGITGLKTTVGRISRHGVLPLASTLDTVGPMCRDVEDCAMLLGLLQGADPSDPSTLGRSCDDPMQPLRRGVAGLVLARLPAHEREGVDVDVLEAYDAALELLQGLGAQIVDVRLPGSFAEQSARLTRIIATEAYANFGTLAEDPNARLNDVTRRRIAVGRDNSATQYLRLLRDRQEFIYSWHKALAGVDALLTPCARHAAPALEGIDGTAVATPFVRFANYVDGCALVLPNGYSSDGLPLSLQIACHGFGESMALRIGWAYENARPGPQRRPEIENLM